MELLSSVVLLVHHLQVLLLLLLLLHVVLMSVGCRRTRCCGPRGSLAGCDLVFRGQLLARARGRQVAGGRVRVAGAQRLRPHAQLVLADLLLVPRLQEVAQLGSPARVGRSCVRCRGRGLEPRSWRLGRGGGRAGSFVSPGQVVAQAGSAPGTCSRCVVRRVGGHGCRGSSGGAGGWHPAEAHGGLGVGRVRGRGRGGEAHLAVSTGYEAQ